MVSVASPFTQDKDQYPKGSLQVLTWFFFSAIKWIHLCRLDRQEEKIGPERQYMVKDQEKKA